MSLKVILVGARGRMGRTLAGLAEECDATVVGELEAGEDPGSLPWAEADAAIDFSFHAAAPLVLEHAAKHGVAVVIGTTGHTEDELAAIHRAAEKIPVSLAGNYSIGVNLLQHLTRLAARILPESYAPEILELHHKHKKDAPSGTALNLAEAVEEAREQSAEARVHGREGETGARPDAQLGMHAIRGGEIVGEHTVFFIGDSDRIELTHRASDRGIFARGAYRAAHWLAGHEPGLFSMQDILGLSD